MISFYLILRRVLGLLLGRQFVVFGEVFELETDAKVVAKLLDHFSEFLLQVVKVSQLQGID